MPQRIREWLTLVLIALLPFHALAVTVLTKIIAGPGHAPLNVLAGWKEALLGFILLITVIEWVKRKERKTIRIDAIDLLILLLLILAVGVDTLTHTGKSQMLLGFKYDFLPLVAFFIARRVPWSEWFMDTVMKVILWVGGIVALYGIVSFFLPPRFFYWLGYSDATSLYIPNGPLAAFQQIGGLNVNRIQGPMSGPNQLGIWLLVPIAVAIGRYKLQVTRNKQISENKDGKQFPFFHFDIGSSLYLVACLLFLALLMSFCRSAWVAALVIVLIAAFPWIRSRMTRRVWIGGAVAVMLVIIAAVVLFPNELIRISSTRGHLDKPIQALEQMIAHPLGQGLGSAGPATNHFSDTCVMLRPQDDPSWAKSQPNLCVFLGTKQVQPLNRVCNCPFLPENWYLQIGVELGWVGMVLYVSLVVLILVKLWADIRRKTEDISKVSTNFHLTSYIFYLVFLAVSVAGLFLHAWEDAAVAYSVWLLIASALPEQKQMTS